MYTKQEIQQRVLQNGKPLDLDKFEWDSKTKTFSSAENNLVLDFSDISYCTFKTGSYCTFDTGCDCTFDTGCDCTFDTGSYCAFDTGSYCVVVRRDVYEVIELVENQIIKLNEYGVEGYTIIKSEDDEVNKAIKLLEEKGVIVNGKILR